MAGGLASDSQRTGRAKTSPSKVIRSTSMTPTSGRRPGVRPRPPLPLPNRPSALSSVSIRLSGILSWPRRLKARAISRLPTGSGLDRMNSRICSRVGIGRRPAGAAGGLAELPWRFGGRAGRLVATRAYSAPACLAGFLLRLPPDLAPDLAARLRLRRALLAALGLAPLAAGAGARRLGGDQLDGPVEGDGFGVLVLGQRGVELAVLDVGAEAAGAGGDQLAVVGMGADLAARRCAPWTGRAGRPRG